jgi:hypothetical protein
MPTIFGPVDLYIGAREDKGDIRVSVRFHEQARAAKRLIIRLPSIVVADTMTNQIAPIVAQYTEFSVIRTSF